MLRLMHVRASSLLVLGDPGDVSLESRILTLHSKGLGVATAITGAQRLLIQKKLICL